MQRERSLRWQYTCCAGSTMQVTSFLHAAQAGGGGGALDRQRSVARLAARRPELGRQRLQLLADGVASILLRIRRLLHDRPAARPALVSASQPARCTDSHTACAPRTRATHSCAHTTGKVLHTLP
jgi:hypothetical protein